MTSIASKLNIHRETLRAWVRTAQRDAGQPPGLTTEERARLGTVVRENKEPRRANKFFTTMRRRSANVTGLSAIAFTLDTCP